MIIHTEEKLYVYVLIPENLNLLQGNSKKMYLRTCVLSEDSDRPAHSRRLIRIFTWRILDSQGCKVFSCGQQKLIRLRDDLSVRWAHMLGGMFF